MNLFRTSASDWPDLPEDQFLRIRCIARAAFPLQGYYLAEISSGQALRVLSPDTSIQIVRLTAEHVRQGWVSQADESPVRALDVATLLSDPSFSVVDLELFIDGGVHLSSHDDGELVIEGPDLLVRAFVEAILRSRGYAPHAILRMAEARRGDYCVIEAPAALVVSFATFDEYLAWCGERRQV
jgi:hypothetical protein